MLGLTRWSPVTSVLDLHRELELLFARGLGRPAESAWWPAIESHVKDGHIHVRLALPGVDPKDVDVTLTDDTLTIKGERKTGHESQDGGYYVREFASGSFERSVALPEGIDPARVTARYVNGMLEITMPEPLAVAPRKVEIQVEGQAPGTKAVKAA